MEDPRYPIGRFAPQTDATPQARALRIAQIGAAPAALRAALAGLPEARLDTPYREGGWTVRQLVHHVADSHLNAYTRFRLALTEDRPTIRPYDEAAWAELADARDAPVELSLALLDALHARWVLLLEAVSPADWDREVVHPEHGRALSLDTLLQLYAWHGRHHVAHVTALRGRAGW